MHISLKISLLLASMLASSGAFALQFSAGFLKQDPAATGPIINPRVVYLPPSCAVPGAKANRLTGSTKAIAGRSFYVDPVKGTAAGDGSQAKPWRTLADVFNTKKISSFAYVNGALVAKNPAGPVKPGDTLVLLSGDHGKIALNDYINPEFITITAAPGARPVLRELKAAGSSKWLISRLTFENADGYKIPVAANGTSYPATLVNMDGRGAAAGKRGKLENIIIVGNTMQSTTTEKAVAWGPKEWMESASNGIGITSGECVTVSHNKVKNVRFGIAVGGTKLNVDHNEVDYFADDALRMVGVSYLNIRNNFLTNHYGRLDDGNHNDGIQGFPLYSAPNDLMHDILIDSNVVIESTGRYATLDNIPGTGAQNYMQGISEFDGKWKDITVNNNLVVGSAWHLISNFGGDGVTITNNTIAGVSTNPKMVPWVVRSRQKMAHCRSAVTITNNVTPKAISNAVGGVLTGNYKSTNQVATFVKFDPANADYDFTLKDPTLKNVGAKLPNMKF